MGSGSWEWGEIYIWGGVTFSPGPSPIPRPLSATAQVVAEASSPDLRQRVLRAVSDQYPVAWREGSFAGKPVTAILTTSRFMQFAEVLGISGEDAAGLVEIDATPLLVEPEGVASAFSRISEAFSRDKASELVRCHPGLLVGGVRSMKAGTGLLTATLVDILFAGRLLEVLEDSSRDNMWKLAEIEHYVRVAAFCKPVMDLLQRREEVIPGLAVLSLPLLTPLLALAGVHSVIGQGLVPSSLELDIMASGLNVSIWLLWFAGKSAQMGPLAATSGSWFLTLSSAFLTLGAFLSSTLLPADEEAQVAARALGLESQLFSAIAGILRGLSTATTGGLP